MKKFTDIKRRKVKKINEEIAVQVDDIEVPRFPLGARNPNENNNIGDIDEPIIGEEGSQIVQFFSKLFESKEMAHIFHLQVNNEENSNVIHSTLDNFYKEMPELIDKLIETYQGQYGIVDGYEIIDTSSTKSQDPVSYYEGVGEYIKNGKQCIDESDTHLHSLIDDIMILLYQTLYKLKYLK